MIFSLLLSWPLLNMMMAIVMAMTAWQCKSLICSWSVAEPGTQTRFYIIFYKHYRPQFPDQEQRLKFRFVTLHQNMCNLCPLALPQLSFSCFSKKSIVTRLIMALFLQESVVCSLLRSYFYTSLYTATAHSITNNSLITTSLTIPLKHKFYWLWRALASIYPVIYLTVLPLLDMKVIFRFSLL